MSDDVEETVLACPSCDRASVQHASNDRYRCEVCNETFAEPVERERRATARLRGDSVASVLDEADPGDLLTDGGTSPRGTNQSERPDNHVSVFPYPGGKGREVDWILERMPPHDTFVDVFGGSGAIIYNKPPSKNEVYNDANDDLVQFFRVLREREDELLKWLRAVPYARSVYEEWIHEFFDGHRPDDPVERAGRFFALRYMQFAGDMSMVNGFKTRAKRSPARTFDNARERIHELADRFRDVIVECRDFERLLETYDDEDVDVLFYCDPPYVGGEHYYPVEFDHAQLVDALADLQNDWMVSYSEVPDGLADLGHVVARDRRHRMCRSASESTEHLVCSFDPSERSQFLENGEQTGLTNWGEST